MKTPFETSQNDGSSVGSDFESAGFVGSAKQIADPIGSFASKNWKKFAPERWRKPLALYAATWISTTAVGVFFYGGGTILGGLMFSVPLMIILTLHELGHYIQAVRYKIRATAPYFIPLPLPPFGTMGAVIRMNGRIPSVKALFDVGVSGPLAGLAATLVFLTIGLACSTTIDVATVAQEDSFVFGEPLLFQWASSLFFDRSDPTKALMFHPIAAAAWVGLFLTTLNLAPLGQLDGGHVFYALLRRRAGYCSVVLFACLVLYVVVFRRWNWILMLALIAFFGVEHPPTGDDSQSLGLFRTILGWATLAFVVVGFTPNPIDVQEASRLETTAIVETVEKTLENPNDVRTVAPNSPDADADGEIASNERRNSEFKNEKTLSGRSKEQNDFKEGSTENAVAI